MRCFSRVYRSLCLQSILVVLLGSATHAEQQPPSAAANAPPTTVLDAEGAAEAPALVASSESVRPGINERFLDPQLDVSEWLGRFEIESREVYAARKQVLAALNLRPGMDVADVGAGTGFYAAVFARAVGPQGKVFAVEIVPKFIDHIARQARAEGLVNLSTVLCQEDSVSLPPRSIDLAFSCDTYHHFEYPQQTLRSIRRALRPGGRLAIVDFERVPGVSSDWTLSHVRAGKETVRVEVEAAGFRFERGVDVKGLQENYLLLFRRD